MEQKVGGNYKRDTKAKKNKSFGEMQVIKKGRGKRHVWGTRSARSECRRAGST